MILREQAGDERIGADCVDHRCQPRRLEQPKASPVRDVAYNPIVLSDYIRRPKSCDRRLLACPRATARLTVQLDLVERLHPLAALKRRRRIGEELIGIQQNKRPHIPQPWSLWCRKCRRGQAPHARARRQRRERGSHANWRETSIVGSQTDDVCCGGQTGSEAASFWRAIRN